MTNLTASIKNFKCYDSTVNYINTTPAMDLNSYKETISSNFGNNVNSIATGLNNCFDAAISKAIRFTLVSGLFMTAVVMQIVSIM